MHLCYLQRIIFYLKCCSWHERIISLSMMRLPAPRCSIDRSVFRARSQTCPASRCRRVAQTSGIIGARAERLRCRGPIECEQGGVREVDAGVCAVLGERTAVHSKRPLPAGKRSFSGSNPAHTELSHCSVVHQTGHRARRSARAGSRGVNEPPPYPSCNPIRSERVIDGVRPWSLAHAGSGFGSRG